MHPLTSLSQPFQVALDPLSSTDRILAPGQIWSQKLKVGSLEPGYAIVEAQFSSQAEDTG